MNRRTFIGGILAFGAGVLAKVPWAKSEPSAWKFLRHYGTASIENELIWKPGTSDANSIGLNAALASVLSITVVTVPWEDRFAVIAHIRSIPQFRSVKVSAVGEAIRENGFKFARMEIAYCG